LDDGNDVAPHPAGPCLPPQYAAACPDCPGARLGTLQEIVGATKHTCAFETVAVEGRAYVPPGWGDRYAFGLVRRGVVIRQRADTAGRAVAVDAAGPGCLFAIEEPAHSGESVPCDYAATDMIVCLLPRAAFGRALDTTDNVSRELIALQQQSIRRVERLTQARGASTVRERIAALLCVLSDTLSPPRRRERLPPGLQQRDLARLLGIRHETLCRVLGELEKESVVRRDPDGLLILDHRALEQMEG
jgi:CRP-like cAMP-binding protein